MDIKITPSKLCGSVNVPSSKSFAHRQIICAALSDGKSVVSNVSVSQDIEATVRAMNTLGADLTINGNTVTANPFKGAADTNMPITIDCGESGSTLRFIIPVAAALGVKATFTGRGKLPVRPLTPYVTELSKNGIDFGSYNGTLPMTISGKLRSGRFEIAGDISSQFITGLILGLSLTDGRSEIILTSRLQSKPYVDITVESLKMFGVQVKETENGYEVSGGQGFKACDCAVEGDFSQAAFFYVANALGSSIAMPNMPKHSVQGDSVIRKVCGNRTAFELDCSDIPDIVPVMSVFASALKGTTSLKNVGRLRIKESDRIETTIGLLKSLGGNAWCDNDTLFVEGVGKLRGGTIDSHNDHRIAMSAAIAATICNEDVIIKDAGCVKKSYPRFFEDYNELGGNANVINLE